MQGENDRMKINWKKYLAISLCAFLVYICITYLETAANIVLSLISASSPLLIGFAIAYMVNILMGFYEKHYFPKSSKKAVVKSRRPVCIIASYVSMVAIISVIFWLVIPELLSCFGLLASAVPGYISWSIEKIRSIEFIPDDIFDKISEIDWNSKISQLTGILTTGVTNFANVVIKTVSSIFSAVVTTLISVIFSVYLLSSKDKLKKQCKKLIETYMPEKIYSKFEYVCGVLNDSFRSYIVGQCLEAVILGVLCTLGMLIFKFPYATMIGALMAFTALIPIAGAYIGAGVGAIMIMTVSPIKALLFLVFIVILQQLEGNIIYPRVVGSSMGLPGIWVLAAITVGGGTFGILGMLLGVPIAATLYNITRDDVNRRQKTKDPGSEQAAAESVKQE